MCVACVTSIVDGDVLTCHKLSAEPGSVHQKNDRDQQPCHVEIPSSCSSPPTSTARPSYATIVSTPRRDGPQNWEEECSTGDADELTTTGKSYLGTTTDISSCCCILLRCTNS